MLNAIVIASLIVIVCSISGVIIIGLNLRLAVGTSFAAISSFSLITAACNNLTFKSLAVSYLKFASELI